MATLRVFAFLALALLAASESKAEIVAYRFQGVIQTFEDPGGITPGVQVGDHIEGGFAYDTQIPIYESQSFPGRLWYYEFGPIAPQEMWITIGGTTFNAAPVGSLAAILEPDRFVLYANDLRERDGSDDVIGLDFSVDDIGLAGSLPVILDLTDGPILAYAEMRESAFYIARASVTSLVRVPEPSTLAMLLAAVPLGYLAYRRRRS